MLVLFIMADAVTAQPLDLETLYVQLNAFTNTVLSHTPAFRKWETLNAGVFIL